MKFYLYYLPFLISGFAGVTGQVSASGQPEQPYAGQQHRQIKSLSEKEITGLLAGHGMGLAKPAELNHYPGPRHVLDLADKLELSERQRQKTQELFADMKQRAQALGKQIITAETQLDALFAKGKADEKSLHQQLLEIARLRGELRHAHLVTHLAQRRILTAHQVKQYDTLRGYNDSNLHHHHGGTHAH